MFMLEMLGHLGACSQHLPEEGREGGGGGGGGGRHKLLTGGGWDLFIVRV